MMETYHYTEPFALESGETLSKLNIGYHAFGNLNEDKSNVIWVCHALTANSDPSEWWPELVGDDKLYDPKDYFIVCANILGSCYGSTGPSSINPETEAPYLKNFPKITVRDMVNVNQILRKHLGIEKIHSLIGGSLGGFQALEWVILEPEIISNLILLCSNAKQSAWGKGIHAAQRLAIASDPTWQQNKIGESSPGLITARAIGLLTYRHYDAYELTQQDPGHELTNFKAESYLTYQGQKLDKRFDPFTYWTLSLAMDTHDISRNRDDLNKVLSAIEPQCLIISISSDQLCPPKEQEFMHQHLPNSQLVSIDSIYGHDGFLIENDQITEVINDFYQKINSK